MGTELSYKMGSYGRGIDLFGRIGNTCNETISVFMTAIVYGEGDRIIGTAEYWTHLRLSPGESQVVKIQVNGSDFDQTKRVNIETSFER